MKILIISDSHGGKETLLKVILHENPEKVFFLGDHISDIYEIEHNITADICAVKGNTDYNLIGLDDIFLNIYNKKILLTHGHNYKVNYGYYRLSLKAQEAEVDYVFFGHTHRYVDFSENGIRFINPGSISKPRDCNHGSYVVMKIDKVNVNFVKKVLT